VITEHDRLLKLNEERARTVKEELLQHHQAMLRCEDELNALALERTNLESDLYEEKVELPMEIVQPLEVKTPNDPKSRWPKVVVGGMILIGVLLGLGDLGIFNDDGSAPVAHRAVLPTPHDVAPSARNGSEMKGNENVNDTFSSIPPSRNTNSTSDNDYTLPGELPLKIFPGITYASEISYSMRSSVVTLMEVEDTPLITLHLSHAPQSFFIPMKTQFRIVSDGIDPSNGILMARADSKKHDLEIRFEPRRLPLETKVFTNPLPK
jgi:hypothetical protein